MIKINIIKFCHKIPKWVFGGFFLLSIASNCHSQIITGIVTGTSGYLNGAFIFNSSTKMSAYTDITGEFRINAKKGDTLTVSSLNYIPDTILIDKPVLMINLKTTGIILNNVFVRSTRLSPLERYRRNQEDYKQIYRIGNMSNIISLNGNSNHAGIGLNIDALYSALSVQGRNARKLQRTLTSDYYDSVVDSRFTTSLVSQVTGYQGEQLDDFIVNNRPSYEFINNASDYDIIQYIKRRMNGVVLESDTPIQDKPKNGGLHIKYKSKAQTDANGTFGAKYIPIHP